MSSSGLLQPQHRGSSSRKPSWLTLPACTAVLQIAGILAGLWWVLHYIQGHLAKQPLVILMFPPLAMGSIALVLPLLMFISYQVDFPGLNPAHPLHFMRICKRCYTALGRNNLKVAEKDL